MDLVAKLDEHFRRCRLTGTTGIVAVSGGPDSVALSYLLLELHRQNAIQRLMLAHINHQLRGDESDGDEAFVTALPALMQLPEEARLTVRTTRIDVAALARAEHENLESIARRERYRWLGELALAEKADWVATGHTADDQAETVLFRLLRGSGVLGLAGMRESRPLRPTVNLIRPLLSIRRQTLLDYLRDKQIAYRVDSSNRDLSFTRNRLRLELLPLLAKDYNPAVVEVLCGLAEQARDLSDDTTARAERLLVEAELPRAGTILVFSLDRLQNRRANEIREMFRALWRRESWPMAEMDFERWQRLVEIAAGTVKTWDFPGKIQARCAGRVMQILPA